jgi:alpha-tubulin suppressor-like RCC1 family protein
MFRIARRALLVLGVLAPMLIVGAPDPGAAAPRPEAGLGRVTQISVGDGEACALVSQRAYCWGDESGGFGQVGNGPSTATLGRAQPVVDVNGSGALPQVIDVAAGDHFACAIASPNRTAYCWGRNDVGQLGNGGGPTSHSPVAVTRSATQTLTNVRQIDAYGSTACAVVVDVFAAPIGAVKRVYCWGEGDSGQLGNDTGDDSARAGAPVKWDDPSGRPGSPLQNLNGLTQVTVGASHACATQSGGNVWCWGQNGAMDFGNWHAIRVVVDGQPFCCATTVDAGGGSTCAVKDAGGERRAYCWGANGAGQLGVGTLEDTFQPAEVQAPSGDADLTGVSAIAVGQNGACAALVTSGRTYCWGGILSDGASPWPIAVRNPSDTGELRNIRLLAVGSTACGRLANLQLRCWGPGTGGTLGNGSTSFAGTPVVVLRP